MPVTMLTGRMHGTYAKGLMAYDTWRDAQLDDRVFSPDILLPMLTGRMKAQDARGLELLSAAAEHME